MAVPQNAWNFLHSTFGGGPACSRLYECSYCKEELGTVKIKIDNHSSFWSQLFETEFFYGILFFHGKNYQHIKLFTFVFFHKSVFVFEANLIQKLLKKF